MASFLWGYGGPWVDGARLLLLLILGLPVGAALVMAGRFFSPSMWLGLGVIFLAVLLIPARALYTVLPLRGEAPWFLLPDRQRELSLGYPLVLTALMFAVTGFAQQVDFRQLTETRAAQAAQAVERLYADHQRYPRSLGELFPQYLLLMPEPVIIYGQTWFYTAGASAYRLGYVTRSRWSDPRLNGKSVRSVGETAEFATLCAVEIETIRANYPEYPFVQGEAGE